MFSGDFEQRPGTSATLGRDGIESGSNVLFAFEIVSVAAPVHKVINAQSGSDSSPAYSVPFITGQVSRY
jgi:hypothetical protein